jgi:3-methyladenine DNA glycosylase AlkD
MIKEIQQRLITLGDSADAQFLQGFFKTGPGQYGEGDLFRGIRVPVLRRLVKQYRTMPLPENEQLLHSPYHEDRLLALLLLVNSYRTSDCARQTAIYELYLANTAFINNWDLVDSSAEHIVGAYLWDKSRAPLQQLATSASLWERRIAMLATFHYIKKHEFNEALRIVGLLVNDREDLMHKAVGWMLREIGKRNLPREEEFLAGHYRIMPRTMLRYAIEKFPEEQRQAYLRGTV